MKQSPARWFNKGAVGRTAALLSLLPPLLGLGCAFHFHCVETTMMIEPAPVAAGEVATIKPKALTPETVAALLRLPLVEMFTDKPTKEKAIDAAIAAGLPVRYVVTRRSSWFVVRAGRDAGTIREDEAPVQGGRPE